MHKHYKIKVPKCDVLVHAGDATFRGNEDEVKIFAEWFLPLPGEHKIFVPGNHDWLFQYKLADALALLPGVHVLIDSAVVIDGIKFWGSPWQPWFLSWAFNLPRGAALKAHWDLIPEDTNVLVTHTPPYGVGDLVDRGENVGCEDMLHAVRRVKPKFHIFGHIHEGYGVYRPRRARTVGWEDVPTTFINASTCNGSYHPVNKPVVVDYSKWK